MSSTPSIRVSPDALIYPFGYDPYFENPILPTADIRASIRVFLQKLEDEVALIDFRLQHTEPSDIRTSLEWAQLHIYRSLDYHRAMVAPIRWLPTEMLSRIFCHCVDDGMDGDRSGSRDGYTSVPFSNHGIPWDITYVCRRWYVVAIATPPIWPRSFAVSIFSGRRNRDDGDLPPLTQGAVFLLGLCLERSRPLPLKIKFQYHLSAAEARRYQSIFITAASTNFRHAHRFRSLDIDIHPGDSIPNPFPPEVSVPFSQLEALTCSGLDGVPPWLSPALETALKLRSLSIENAPIFQDLAAPFSQITHLTLGSPYGSASVNLALRAMSLMPNLEDCSLYISSSDEELTMPMVTMPVLRSLMVESDGVVEEEFTEMLMLPSLQQVTLFSPNEPATCVQRLIDRCHCTITSIGIMIEDSNITGLAALLPNLAPLRTLRILVGASLNALDVLLDGLMLRDDSYPAPCLEELYFEGLPLYIGDPSSSVGDNRISKIIEVIRSRLYPPPGSVILVSALRIVSLTFSIMTNGDQILSMSEYLSSPVVPSVEVMSNLEAICRMGPDGGSRCEVVAQLNIYGDAETDAVKYSFERNEWEFWSPPQVWLIYVQPNHSFILMDELDPADWDTLGFGGFVVTFSMLSLFVKEKLYINEVVLGTAFGIIIGPHALNIFDPRGWGADSNAITLEVMRIILATGLFAIGIELPRSYMAKHAKGLLTFVVPTMAIGWLITSGLLRLIFPNLTFISCLVIAACLTPTDPIICSTIVGGRYATKHVPVNLRRLLAAESAANDGMAYPFLSLAIYLSVDASKRAAFGHWFLIGWLYQVILGVILGALLGVMFSWMLKKAHQYGLIDRESFVAQYLALTFLTMGVTSTLGSDDLLATFAAGNALSWDGNFNTQVEGEVFASVIDLVLNCACFIYLGAWLPFDTYNTSSMSVWRLIVLFFAILFLRRIPSTLALYKYVPEITSWREALFSGHFGPMGVGAVFISTLALTKLPEPHNPPENQQELLAAYMHPIVSFVVLGSIMIHGLSIPFFSFGRNVTRTLSTRSGIDTPDWLLTTSTARNTATNADRPENSRPTQVEANEANYNTGIASGVSSRNNLTNLPVEQDVAEGGMLPDARDGAERPEFKRLNEVRVVLPQ